MMLGELAVAQVLRPTASHTTLCAAQFTLEELVTALKRHGQLSKRSGSSRYRGVTWHKGSCKWRAQATEAGKHCHLGEYGSEEDAAIAYDKGVVEARGLKANPNFGFANYLEYLSESTPPVCMLLSCMLSIPVIRPLVYCQPAAGYQPTHQYKGVDKYEHICV
jgi:hypothetical protein